MAKKKPASSRARKVSAKAGKAVRRATKVVAGARAAARRAVKRARKTTTRQVAAARSAASKLMKNATRLAKTQRAKAVKLVKASSPALAARKLAARPGPPKAEKAKAALTKAAKARTAAAKVRTAAKPRPKTKAAAKPRAVAATARPTPAAAKGARKATVLDRPRRTVADVHGLPSSLDGGDRASAARSGHAEMEERLRRYTSTSPVLTAGDVDADWASAEAVGDEAPGGDNPTPDQDVVEEIGRALGVEYQDDEELKGGDEITERDRHRWELDPESSDDFEDR